ncbi:MAG: polysaccharide deacetylase family protein [Planctomycetes bacterium]|nr:polysaccharide deacetylase family protein [Planctomycetota bacterium]
MRLPLLARRLARFARSGSSASREYRECRRSIESAEALEATGTVCLSVDFELAWSRARRGEGSTSREESLERARRAREALPALLALCEAYRIPATFAVVAHVALDRCDLHRPPPPFRPGWFGEDWFAACAQEELAPGGDIRAPDLVRQILTSPVGHELASHGFSHVDLSDEATTPEVARFEIEESARILRGLDPRVSTFIFPKNRPAHLEALARAGFVAYRTREQAPLSRDPHGLWRFPLGLWLSPEAVSPAEVVSLVELAGRRRGLLGLWCHLYEFEDPSRLRAFFEPVFEAVRSTSGVKADTMRTVVERHVERA